MIVLGAVMTKVAQQYDITIVFCEIGIPVLGMLVLIAKNLDDKYDKCLFWRH